MQNVEQQDRLTSTMIILNRKGLHTRPATEFVKCASTFQSSITLHYKDYSVNGKSLLGILMLAASKGAKIIIEAVGDDARGAIDSLLQLAEQKFNMQY